MRTPTRACLTAAVAAPVLLAGTPALAAPTDRQGPDTGYDVSHPQCDADLPDEAAFAVVGVNGGLATRPNPCLDEQLAWAADTATGTADQPPVQLYVNTANPGEVIDQVTTWPDVGDTPYGTCDGTNTTACSWLYGKVRAAVTSRAFFFPAAREAGLDTDPAEYVWWLDVETANTWQSGSPEALARNRAALEGMTHHLTDAGATVGLYSTGYQWRLIVGEVPDDSPLHGLDSWLAGARDAEQAARFCDREPLVGGGRVVLTQYVEDDLDHNAACPPGDAV